MTVTPPNLAGDNKHLFEDPDFGLTNKGPGGQSMMFLETWDGQVMVTLVRSMLSAPAEKELLQRLWFCMWAAAFTSCSKPHWLLKKPETIRDVT